MTTSHVNTAMAAIVAALQSAPAVCPQVDRVRLRPVPQSVDLAAAVRPVQTEADQALLSGMPVSWTTTVSIECYARSKAATDPDTEVDGLLCAVYARLMADPTLGGAVISLQPKGISYDFDAHGDQSTCASMVFTIRHRTAGATLS